MPFGPQVSYLGRGAFPHAEQSFRTAEREVRKVIASEPTQTDAFVQLALAQSMLGEHAAALASIDTARTLLRKRATQTIGRMRPAYAASSGFVRGAVRRDMPKSRVCCACRSTDGRSLLTRRNLSF